MEKVIGKVKEKKMNIYVCSPPRVTTGGVELLQQLVFELNKQHFGIAKLLYIDNTPEMGHPVPEQYEKYKNPFLVNTYNEKDAVIVLPEVMAVMAETQFRRCSVIIWWESVDNYFLANPVEKWYSFKKNKSILHMTQSMYAKDFLKKAGVSEEQIFEVSDYLGEDFFTEEVLLDSSKRKLNVLYNPKKGLDFTNKLIAFSPNLHWIPIAQMSPDEVSHLMLESRVYIDFGNHPGKDRMPREAAISGCCIVTGRNGSADYYEDIPIMDQYKFKRTIADVPAICSCIEQLVNEYDTYISDFEYYRSFIRAEKSKFEKAVSDLLSILLEHNPFRNSEEINVIQKLEDRIQIAVYGTENYSITAKNLIENLYNMYLQDLDPNNYKFEVTHFVVEKPFVSMQKGVPVIELKKFVTLYKEQKVAAIVIPTAAYIGQSFLITDLIQAGVDINDIYCIGRNLLKQNQYAKEELSHLLVPYLDCPYLPYLEYHVVDHCNLNCKACEHYAPLVEKKKITNYEQFKKDFFQLKSFIKDIGIIRIMGGEPLLNKELKKFLLLTKEVYPDSKIAVVTNALLLKQMEDELFYLMKIVNGYFSISWYPPMKDKIEEIKEFLNKKGVSYWVSPLMENFTIKQNVSGDNDKTEQFFRCLQAHCHNLYEGKIAACFLPFVTPYFNQTFQKAIPCDGAVDLYQPNLTLCQIKQALLTPMNRCRYCSPPVSVAWQQANPNSPKLEDWIIERKAEYSK